MTIEGIQEAFQRLDENTMRYQGVFFTEVQSFPSPQGQYEQKGVTAFVIVD